MAYLDGQAPKFEDTLRRISREEMRARSAARPEGDREEYGGGRGCTGRIASMTLKKCRITTSDMACRFEIEPRQLF